VCLVKNADGGFDVYYVSGWKPPDDKKLGPRTFVAAWHQPAV